MFARFRRAYSSVGVAAAPGAAVGEVFLGVIATAGPNGESDFAGAQYWVRRQWPDRSLTTGEALRVEDEPTPGIFDTVPATNLCEMLPDQTATGTHLLRPGLVVLVACIEMQKAEPTRQYVIGVPPGVVIVQIGSPHSTAGEYDGTVMTGAATGMPPAGLSGGPACVVEHLAENGGQMLETGAYHSAVVIGAESDGTPIVAVDAGTLPLGSAQYQVYQMTSNTSAGWDWVRAH
jgi:hypothetical protein